MNTYRKLRDGSWAVLWHLGPNTVAGNAPPKSGDTVRVTKRNGTTKNEKLGEYLGTFDGAMTFRIA